MTPKFVGLYNYTHLAKDAVFVQSFKNNLLIAVITVPVSIALSAMMALFTEKVKFSRPFARLSFFYPTVLPMVAVANIWLFIYTPGYGLLGHNHNAHLEAGGISYDILHKRNAGNIP